MTADPRETATRCARCGGFGWRGEVRCASCAGVGTVVRQRSNQPPLFVVPSKQAALFPEKS